MVKWKHLWTRRGRAGAVFRNNDVTTLKLCPQNVRELNDRTLLIQHPSVRYAHDSNTPMRMVLRSDCTDGVPVTLRRGRRFDDSINISYEERIWMFTVPNTDVLQFTYIGEDGENSFEILADQYEVSYVDASGDGSAKFVLSSRHDIAPVGLRSGSYFELVPEQWRIRGFNDAAQHVPAVRPAHGNAAHHAPAGRDQRAAAPV